MRAVGGMNGSVVFLIIISICYFQSFGLIVEKLEAVVLSFYMSLFWSISTSSGDEGHN